MPERRRGVTPPPVPRCGARTFAKIGTPSSVKTAVRPNSKCRRFRTRNGRCGGHEQGFLRVAGYRLYGLDGQKVASGEWFEAEDDETATRAAREKDGTDSDCELWQGGRFVARYRAQAADLIVGARARPSGASSSSDATRRLPSHGRTWSLEAGGSASRIASSSLAASIQSAVWTTWARRRSNRCGQVACSTPAYEAPPSPAGARRLSLGPPLRRG